jgi:hypothetical protein
VYAPLFNVPFMEHVTHHAIFQCASGLEASNTQAVARAGTLLLETLFDVDNLAP